MDNDELYVKCVRDVESRAAKVMASDSPAPIRWWVSRGAKGRWSVVTEDEGPPQEKGSSPDDQP